MCRAVRRELTQDWEFSCFSLLRYNMSCCVHPWPCHEVHPRFYRVKVSLWKTLDECVQRCVNSRLLSSVVPLSQMLRPQRSPRCALELHQRVVFKCLRRALRRFSDHLKGFFCSTKMRRSLGFVVHPAGDQRTSDCVAETAAFSFSLGVLLWERNQFVNHFLKMENILTNI